MNSINMGGVSARTIALAGLVSAVVGDVEIFDTPGEFSNFGFGNRSDATVWVDPNETNNINELWMNLSLQFVKDGEYHYSPTLVSGIFKNALSGVEFYISTGTIGDNDPLPLIIRDINHDYKVHSDFDGMVDNIKTLAKVIKLRLTRAADYQQEFEYIQECYVPGEKHIVIESGTQMTLDVLARHTVLNKFPAIKHIVIELEDTSGTDHWYVYARDVRSQVKPVVGPGIEMHVRNRFAKADSLETALEYVTRVS